MTRAFISYAHIDREFALRLAAALTERGFDPWIDHEGIHSGARWSTSVQEGLDACEALVLVVSPESMASSNVEDEWQYALDQGKPVAPVMLRAAKEHFQLGRIQFTDFESQDFEAAVGQLAAGLRRAIEARRVGADTDRGGSAIAGEATRSARRSDVCPYRGLHAFTEADARYFFGREVFVDLLRDALAGSPMLGVVGPSGSGKSSVVHAGLVPALRSQADGDGNGALAVVDMRPGSQPFHALARAIVPWLEGEGLSEADRLVETTKIADYLREGTLRPRDVLRRVGEKHPQLRRMLLVADQFEELYTLTADKAERGRFQDLLFEAVHENGQALPLSLVLTLRADFMGHALSYRPFADALQQHDVKLGPMNREELGRVIARPAELEGRSFASGLVERIIDDVGEEAGALPLLEFALTKLWERQTAGQLTHEAYEAIGRVEGAVARHADAVFEGLGEEDRKRARKVVVQMVRPGEGTEDTRRVARKDELGEEGWALVRKLADARLLVTNRDESGRETAEVVHEALIRTWGRLKEWMGEDRRFRMWQERLRFGIRQWEEAGRDEGALLRGVPLAEAEQWLDERGAEMTEAEREYVAAGTALRDTRAAARREREARERALEARGRRLLRAVAGVSAVAAVVGLVLAGVAWRARAAEARAAEVARSTGLAAEAQRLFDAGDRSAALALAVEAAQIPDPPAETGQMLAAAAFAPGTRRVLGPVEGPIAQMVVDHERGRVYLQMRPRWLGEDDVEPRTVQVLDSVSGERVGQLADAGAVMYRLAIDASGERVAGASYRGAGVVIWDALDGRILRQWQDLLPPPTSVAFLDRADLLLAGADLLDPRTGRHLTRLSSLARRRDMSIGEIRAPDQVVVASSDGVQAFSLATRKTLWTRESTSNFIRWSAVSRDGSLFAMQSDNHVQLYDGLEGRMIGRLDAPGGVTLTSGALGPRGELTALGTEDGQILVFDNGTKKRVDTLGGHQKDVSALDFSPDATSLYSASLDRTVRVWDLNRGDRLQAIRSPAGGGELAWSRDDSTLLSLDRYSDTQELARIEVQPAESPGEASMASLSSDASAPADRVSWGPVTLDGAAELQQWRYDIAKNGLKLAFTKHLDLTVIDTQTFEVLWQHPHPHGRISVYGLRFTEDGARLVTVGYDAAIQIWDADSGELVGKHGLDAPGYGLVLNREATWAVTRLLMEDALVRVDLTTGEVLQRFEEPCTDRVFALSPDERRIVAGGLDGTVTIWDLQRGTVERRLEGHSAGIRHVAFAPDGRRVLTSSVDETVRVWDLASGQTVARLPGGHDARFRADGRAIFARSPDQRQIEELHVGASIDEVLEWVASNRFVAPLDCTTRRRLGVEGACDLAAEEADQAPSPGHVPAWHTKVPTPPSEATYVAPHATPTLAPIERALTARFGRQFGRLEPDRADAWAIEMEQGQALMVAMRRLVPEGADDEASLEVGLDPHLLLRGPGGDVLSMGEDVKAPSDRSAIVSLARAPSSGIYTIEARSSEPHQGGDYELEVSRSLWMTAADGGYKNLRFSPDGRRLLATSENGGVRILDVASGRSLAHFQHDNWRVFDGDFDPRNEVVASGGWLGFAALWSLESGELIGRLDARPGAVGALRYAPDGLTLATGTVGGEITIWDAQSGDVVRRIEAHEDTVVALEHVLGGSHLLSAGEDGGLTLWDPATGDARWSSQGVVDSLRAIALHPNGTEVVSISAADSSGVTAIHSWRLEDGQPLRTLEVELGQIWDGAFVLGGEVLLLASSADAGQVIAIDPETGAGLGRWWAHPHRFTYRIEVHEGQGVAATVENGLDLRVWRIAEVLDGIGVTSAVTSVATTGESRANVAQP